MTKFLSAKETADLLGVSRYTVYRMIERGELPAHKIGRLVRIPQTGINALLENTRWGHTPVTPR